MQADIAVATSALKRFQRSGAVAPAVPTPHRLLRACGQAHIERSLSHVVDVETSAGVMPVAVQGVRIRVTSGPFETMASKRQLDSRDEGRNRALASAGRKYLSLWTRAGLSPIQGQDPGKIRSTAVGAGLLGTERKCEAFKEYNAARAALNTRERVAVHGIVFHDIALDEIGRRIGAVREKKLATTLAAHELRCGLEALAIHFGMLEESAPIVVDDPDGITPQMAGLLAEIALREGAAA